MQLPVDENSLRLRLAINQPNFSGILSEPLVFAIQARVMNGCSLPKEPASAMRCHVLSLQNLKQERQNRSDSLLTVAKKHRSKHYPTHGQPPSTKN